MLPGEAPPAPEEKQLRGPASDRPKQKAAAPAEQAKARVGGLRFVAAIEPAKAPPAPTPKIKRKVKNDPVLVAAARELRDRWLEQVNANVIRLTPVGKYQVERPTEAISDYRPPPLLLPAA